MVQPNWEELEQLRDSTTMGQTFTHLIIENEGIFSFIIKKSFFCWKKWELIHSLRVSREEFYQALEAKIFEYNILPSDYKMHGPGKFFGYNQFFQLDPIWAATVEEHSGKISIFEQFLETANTDVLKNWNGDWKIIIQNMWNFPYICETCQIPYVYYMWYEKLQNERFW